MIAKVHRTDFFGGHFHAHVHIRAAVDNTGRVGLGDRGISNMRCLLALLLLLRRGRLGVREHCTESRRHRSGMHCLGEDGRRDDRHRHSRG